MNVKVELHNRKKSGRERDTHKTPLWDLQFNPVTVENEIGMINWLCSTTLTLTQWLSPLYHGPWNGLFTILSFLGLNSKSSLIIHSNSFNQFTSAFFFFNHSIHETTMLIICWTAFLLVISCTGNKSKSPCHDEYSTQMKCTAHSISIDYYYVGSTYW